MDYTEVEIVFLVSELKSGNYLFVCLIDEINLPITIDITFECAFTLRLLQQLIIEVMFMCGSEIIKSMCVCVHCTYRLKMPTKKLINFWCQMLHRSEKYTSLQLYERDQSVLVRGKIT